VDGRTRPAVVHRHRYKRRAVGIICTSDSIRARDDAKEWDVTPDAGLVFAVFGSVVGIAVGLFATWSAVRGARTREEKAALLKVSYVLWTGLFLLVVPATLAVLGLIDRWVYLGLAVLFIVALIPFLIWANRCVENACKISGLKD